MNLRKIILFYFLLFLCITATAQNTGNSRVKLLSAISDTTKLDTLSLVPGSIKIKIADGRLLDTSYYKINYADGLLILNRKKI